MNVPVKQEGISYKNVPMASHGGGGMLMPQTFGEVVAFSEIMARSQHAIPKHLRDVPGACLAVAMQAMRWEMDIFAVASKSYNVKDMIAYEAQLIAAVVNTRAPLKTMPVYTYAGIGPERRCTVTAMFNDGIERSYESPRFIDIKIKNSPLWVADPDQQQGYYSIRAFARRYCPEVILGVYTPEEAQSFQGPDNARDVTPRAAGVPISQRIAEIGHTNHQPVTGGANHSETTHDAIRHETNESLIESAADAQSHPDRNGTVDDASPRGSHEELNIMESEQPKTSDSTNPNSSDGVPTSESLTDDPVANGSPLSNAAGNGGGDGVSESTAPSPLSDLSPDWQDTYLRAMSRVTDRPKSLTGRHTEALQLIGGKANEDEQEWMKTIYRLTERRLRGEISKDECDAAIREIS